MNWFNPYSPADEGSQRSAGERPTQNSANGNCVMYAEGKILTVNGAEAFAVPDYPAHGEATVIDINSGEAVVRQIGDAHKKRVYAGSTVLPDGTVFISGGLEFPKEFSDAYPHYESGACPAPVLQQNTRDDLSSACARCCDSMFVLV